VFARARRDGDPEEIVADRQDFGDLGRGGVRLQAALCALELLMPDTPAP
jgi:nicotinamide-nucleotide amidase